MLTRFACCLLWLFIQPLHAEPLYWSATKGSTQLILLGSLHVGSDQLYPLPDQLAQKLKQSAGLVVETDIRHQSNITLPATTLSSEQVLSDEQLFVLDGIAQQLRLDASRSANSPMVSQPYPANAPILEMGYQADRGIDLYFMQQAEQHQLPILSLETLQFQVDLLAHLPNSGQELLVSLIDEWENNTQLTECMIESWKKEMRRICYKCSHSPVCPLNWKPTCSLSVIGIGQRSSLTLNSYHNKANLIWSSSALCI